MSKDPLIKRRAMEYLVAAYGPDKLNDPSQAEPIVQKMIADGPERADGLLPALARSTRMPAATRRPKRRS